MRYSIIKAIISFALMGVVAGVTQAAPDYKNHLKTEPALPSAKASESLLTDIVVVDGKVVTVGDRGHILVSTDNGESWVQSDVPVQLLLTAVDFPTPTSGWAVGHEGLILHSSDGGKSWEIQHANPHRVLSNEEMDQLTDEQFSKLPQAGSPLLDVWFSNEKEGFVVGAYGMFLSTVDGGKTWTDAAARIDNYDGWHLNTITSNGNGVVYIAGEKGVLFRSDDGGENWITLQSPYEGSFFGSLVGPGVDDVFVFGLQGNIFKSNDRGDSWAKAKSKNTDGVMDGVVLGENGVILVGNSGVILTSKDAGSSYSVEITPSRQAILAIDKMANGKLVMVGQGGVQFVTPALK